MTVGELKEVLEDCSDYLTVYIYDAKIDEIHEIEHVQSRCVPNLSVEIVVRKEVK